MASSFARVLAFDHQHRNAVDEKDHILPRAVAAVVDIKLLGHFIYVAPLLARAVKVAVINERQVQLTVLLRAEELSLVAQIGKKIAVAGDVGVQPLKFANQRALGLLVFRIEGTHLAVQQVAEVKRCRSGTVFAGGAVGIETPPRLGFGARHKAPADLLRVMQDAGLDGFVFAGSGHGYSFRLAGRISRTAPASCFALGSLPLNFLRQFRLKLILRHADGIALGLQCVFHLHVVLLRAEDDADRRPVVRRRVPYR